jgi:two-component system, OmpR family, response regulator RpaA
MMAKIVVIDDDAAILELVKINLQLQGHQVVTAPDAIQGFAFIQQELPNLAVVDLMMPKVDGYTLSQRIRKIPALNAMPILMLTALSEVKDKVKGFDSGADDYLVKPFELPELLVRVRALLRRSGSLPASTTMREILSAGHITLIPENLEIKLQQAIIKLTPTEFEIMNCLMQNHGHAIALSKLLQDVWGYAPDDDVETIRVHVRHLRAKLEKVSPDLSYIETIYGGGYRLLPEGKPQKEKPSS